MPVHPRTRGEHRRGRHAHATYTFTARAISRLRFRSRLSNAISDGVSILGANELVGLALGELVEAVAENLAPPVFKLCVIAVSEGLQGLWGQGNFGRVALADQRDGAEDRVMGSVSVMSFLLRLLAYPFFYGVLMGAMLEELEAQALKLSPRERSELIHRLLISLDGEPEGTPDEIAKAWDEEIARRVADMEAGRTKWIPAEEVFKEIDALIAAHNK